MADPYRPYVGATVRVTHSVGETIGTLWSVTKSSLWLLVDGADEFVSIAKVVGVEVTT